MESPTRHKSQKIEKAIEPDILCEVCERFIEWENIGWCDYCETYHCARCAHQKIDTLSRLAHSEIWNYGLKGKKR